MKQFLVITCIACTIISAVTCDSYVADIHTQQNLRQGMIAYWPITGTNYMTQPELSGNGYALVLQASDALNIGTGKYSTALNFHNCSMRGLCQPGSTIVFPESDGVTAAMWIRSDSTTGGMNKYLISCGSPGYYLILNDNVLTFYGPAAGSSSPSYTITQNTWYYVAGIYDRNTIGLYVNGMLIGTNAVASPISVQASTFIWIMSSAGGWTGMLDEIRVYNRVLNADEINELMAIGRD
jgi:hypothetical protein